MRIYPEVVNLEELKLIMKSNLSGIKDGSVKIEILGMYRDILEIKIKMEVLNSEETVFVNTQRSFTLADIHKTPPKYNIEEAINKAMESFDPLEKASEVYYSEMGRIEELVKKEENN